MRRSAGLWHDVLRARAGFNIDAIAWSMPRGLRWAAAEAPLLPAERVWTTLLCCAALEGMAEHLLLQACARLRPAKGHPNLH